MGVIYYEPTEQDLRDWYAFREQEEREARRVSIDTQDVVCVDCSAPHPRTDVLLRPSIR